MFDIPLFIHDIALAVTISTLIALLVSRAEDFLLFALIGAESILLNISTLGFPENPTAAEYLALNVVECVVYATVGFMISSLRADGAIGVSRTYYFLAAFSVMVISEFFIVNTLGYWQTAFVHDSSQAVRLVCVVFILVFAIFGDKGGGKRKRHSVVGNCSDSAEHVSNNSN